MLHPESPLYFFFSKSQPGSGLVISQKLETVYVSINGLMDKKKPYWNITQLLKKKKDIMKFTCKAIKLGKKKSSRVKRPRHKIQICYIFTYMRMSDVNSLTSRLESI